MQVIPGDRLWYRDPWGIPARIEVDVIDGKARELVGVNERRGIVRIAISKVTWEHPNGGG